MPECIDQVVTRSGWKERKGKLPKGRGLGVACSHYVSGAANSIIRSDMPHSTVNIKIDRDGGVVVYTGASEIGQGSDTMTAQVVAEVLGCDLARVRVIAADTDLTPIDLGSYSSRVTFMAGNAALRAAQDVKKNIVSAAAKRMNCAPEDVIMRDDRVWKRGTVPGDHDPTRQRSWKRWTRRAAALMGRFCAARCCRRAKKKAQRAHELRGSRGFGHRLSRRADGNGLVRASDGSARRQAQRRQALGRRRRIRIRRRWPKSAWMKKPAK